MSPKSHNLVRLFKTPARLLVLEKTLKNCESIATLTLTNITLTGNSANEAGGGIDNYNSTTTISSSLISGNTASAADEISTFIWWAGYTFTVNAYNLFSHSDLSNSEAFRDFTPGALDITATSDGTNPTALTSILDTTLADNGGSTQTHALVSGSPAINAGQGSLATDQRDAARDDGSVDIGAFEECFLTGTRILTDRGEVLVENLNIGDLVQTADGEFQAIKWIGRQTREPNQVRYSLRGYPIQIKAGALGNGLPHRDLFVSPDHALLFDGLLINAGAMVNDRSILKTTPTDTFVYHHIELAHHSLLVAEGTAAESYLPQKEDRQSYDNGDEYLDLYPHNDILCYWPMKYPRVSSKRQLPRFVYKHLTQIAKTLDAHTPDTTHVQVA